MKVDELALEMTQGPTGPPAWAVGQGAFCLWRGDNDENEPVPRIYHLRGLQSLWIKIGATRCPMQVDACVAEWQRVFRGILVFRSRRLPEVIRRPAAFFDAERALEWIERGRIVEVAQRYDRAVSY